MNISIVLEIVLEMHFEYKLSFLFLSVSHKSIVIKIILLTNFWMLISLIKQFSDISL